MTKSLADIIKNIEHETKTGIELEALMSSIELLKLLEKQSVTEKPCQEDEIYNIIGDEVAKCVYDLLPYWKQVGFFDAPYKHEFDIVSNMSKIVLSCVNANYVSTDDTEEENVNHLDFDDDQ